MRKSALLSCVLVLMGCARPLPSLEGIDLTGFKSDKGACQQVRTKSIPLWDSQREKLKALSEMDLIEMLGKPDQTELYTRNQKTFRYYLEPGPSCPAPGVKSRQLVIRFNAIGLAKEVTVE